MPNLLILIPAAGQSSRMRGDDKLLRQIDGRALLLRQTERALQTGQNVLVTLPLDRPARLQALAPLASNDLLSLSPIDGSEGMSASLRTGAEACLARGLDGMMIALPDMPDIDQGDLNRLIDAFSFAPDTVCRATTSDGKPGHPAILPRRMLPAVSRLTGDTGAKEILSDEAFTAVPLDQDRARLDLDTPEAWASWESDR